jgi:hypothetical protein
VSQCIDPAYAWVAQDWDGKPTGIPIAGGRVEG